MRSEVKQECTSCVTVYKESSFSAIHLYIVVYCGSDWNSHKKNQTRSCMKEYNEEQPIIILASYITLLIQILLIVISTYRKV